MGWKALLADLLTLIAKLSTTQLVKNSLPLLNPPLVKPSVSTHQPFYPTFSFIFLFAFCCLFSFCETGSLYISGLGWPQTHDLPTSSSGVLGWLACATKPGFPSSVYRLFIFILWGEVWCSPGWPWTLCKAEGSLEFLALPPPPPKRQVALSALTHLV